MTVTDDLSEFGYRELEEAGKLLSQVKDIDDSGELKVYFNTESGYVFLSDSDMRVWVLDGNDIIQEFFTCPNCGNEGILKDFKDQMDDCSDCEELYERESEESKCHCCRNWEHNDNMEGDICIDCSNDYMYCESCDQYKEKAENERNDMCDSCFEDQEDPDESPLPLQRSDLD